MSVFAAPEVPTASPTLPSNVLQYTFCPLDTLELWEQYAGSDRKRGLWAWADLVWPEYVKFREHAYGYVALDRRGRVVAGAMAAFVGGGTCEPDIFTSRTARRKGLASHLSGMLLRQAFALRAERLAKGEVFDRPAVNWTCDVSNTASRKIAKKLGYEEIGTTTVLQQVTKS